VQRVAKRIHWTPSDDLVKLVAQAAAEPDAQKRSPLYLEYEKAMIDRRTRSFCFGRSIGLRYAM
jgi:peptide/nickel transport system substrate-binding protein